MLLNPKDSALLNFSQSNDKGVFTFKNVKNVAYLLKISYVGYLPYQQFLDPSVSEVHNLQTVKIKPITKELLEVVIRTAKAPFRFAAIRLSTTHRLSKCRPAQRLKICCADCRALTPTAIPRHNVGQPFGVENVRRIVFYADGQQVRKLGRKS